MKPLILTILITLALPLIGIEKQSAETLESLQDYEQSFVLPIDVTNTIKTNLTATIPNGYRSLQPLAEFSQPNSIMIEYIPKNERDDSWSEIITVFKFIGYKFSAKTYAKELKNRFFLASTNGKILSESNFIDKKIEQSFFMMQYTYQGHREIIGTVCYSGPFDSAAVQYTIRLKQDQTDEAAINKINSFFQNNVKKT